MCNLSEVIIEKGIKQGIEQGIEKGIEQGIEQGIEKGIAVLIQDNIEEGKNKQQIIGKLVRRFGITESEAEKFYDRFSLQ